MDILTIAFLVGVGVIAGIIAAIVGGAAVVIYPALIATGVPPHLAAVSNLASVMPGTMLAALSDRSQLPPFDRAFVSLIFASIIGAGIGAVCLVLTPERVFAQIVPLLLGFATLLFAYSERISRWLRKRAEGRGHAIAFNVASLKVVLPVSFYGGYFGAGVGILMLGVFSLATGGDYRSANVAKNFVSSLNGLAATLVFATQGAVLWPQTLALAAGTIGGGLVGAYVARIIPRNVIRVLVIVVGATLTIAFARHARRHRAVWIGKRVDGCEMVRAGNFLVAGERCAPPPAFGDCSALPQELVGFQGADDGIEASSGRNAPVQRRDAARVRFVESQVLVHGDLNQWQKIEHAGNRICGWHEIGRRIGRKTLPVGRHHAGGEVSTRRMAVDENALPPLAPEHQACRAHLLDDVGDRHAGAQIITGNCYRNAEGIRAGRRLREHRRLERAPVAAMNKHRQRGLIVVPRRENIDGPAYRRAV
jgi:uncharacterized membrane protein YfcA